LIVNLPVDIIFPSAKGICHRLTYYFFEKEEKWINFVVFLALVKRFNLFLGEIALEAFDYQQLNEKLFKRSCTNNVKALKKILTDKGSDKNLNDGEYVCLLLMENEERKIKVYL
jgi:hypothetical protein